MEFLPALIALGLANLLAVMSPGPAFLVVTRAAAADSRRAGLAAAFGVGAGSLAWACLVLLGFGLILEQAAWLHGWLRILGGLYLLYLGLRLWLGAFQPLDLASNGSGGGRSATASLRTGLLTQLFNPKAAVFFGSIFVTLLPADPPLWLQASVLAMIFCNEFLWYVLVAFAFSSAPSQRAYGRAKAWIDRVTGTLLALLGLKLALSET